MAETHRTLRRRAPRLLAEIVGAKRADLRRGEIGRGALRASATIVASAALAALALAGGCHPNDECASGERRCVENAPQNCAYSDESERWYWPNYGYPAGWSCADSSYGTHCVVPADGGPAICSQFATPDPECPPGGDGYACAGSTQWIFCSHGYRQQVQNCVMCVGNDCSQDYSCLTDADCTPLLRCHAGGDGQTRICRTCPSAGCGTANDACNVDADCNPPLHCFAYQGSLACQ